MQPKAKGDRRRPFFFYGWVVVAVGFVTLGVAFGLWYSFSLFFLAIIEDFGWSRAAVSSIFSVFVFSHALVAPLTGHLQDRFGPRMTIPLGCILLVVSLTFTSRAHEWWYFLVFYGVVTGAGVSLLGFSSHAAFIPRWFERKRGLAVGTTMAGIGFGMLFLIPAVEWSIRTFGWRSTYLFLAGLFLFFVGPINFLFSRRSPSDMGLKPDGENAAKSEGPNELRPRRVMRIMDTAWAGNRWGLWRAMATGRFWYLVFVFFFLSYAYQGTLLHAISVMVENGIEKQSAAYYFGVLGLAGSVGKVILGHLSDLFGREKISTVGGTLAVFGILCLMHARPSQMWFATAFAVLFGLGYGAAAPLLPSLSADVFMGDSFGKIFAMICIGGGAGGATGSYFCGLLRDITGGYGIPLALFMGSILLSVLLVWLAGPRKVRRMVRTDRN